MENRPKAVPERLTEGFRFRTSAREAARIRRLVADSGLTLSEFLRAAAQRQRLRPPALPRLHLATAGGLGRIGNNLNQLTRHANAGRFSPAVVERLEELRGTVAALQAQLLEVGEGRHE